MQNGLVHIVHYTGAHTAVWVAMKHHVFISPCISTTKYGISYSKTAIACSTTLAIIVYHAVYVSWYITGLQCLYNMGLSDWHTGSIYLYLSSVLSTHAPANMQQKRCRHWYWFSRAVACIMKLFVWSTKSLSTYNARRQHCTCARFILLHNIKEPSIQRRGNIYFIAQRMMHRLECNIYVIAERALSRLLGAIFMLHCGGTEARWASN